jgi:ComF family protein
MKLFLRQVLDELLPCLCLLCDEPATPTELTCAAHRWPSFDAHHPRCTRCARRLPAGFGLGLTCAPCTQSTPRFAAVHPAADYHGAVREWLLAFKHGGRRELAEHLAARVLPRLPPTPEPVLWVPVPLHRWRHWARGYDQAQMLAKALARARGEACESLLRRVRATRPQGSALAPSREANVHDAFVLRTRAPGVAQGRIVWLVDDVLTSGATVNECARLLLQAGAARVEVVVVARA